MAAGDLVCGLTGWFGDGAQTEYCVSQAAEVARYRAGEKKLFGVLIGAAMRETQGAADAATVRQVLTEKLG